jgi:hypothetical protein
MNKHVAAVSEARQITSSLRRVRQSMAAGVIHADEAVSTLLQDGEVIKDTLDEHKYELKGSLHVTKSKLNRVKSAEERERYSIFFALTFFTTVVAYIIMKRTRLLTIALMSLRGALQGGQILHGYLQNSTDVKRHTEPSYDDHILNRTSVAIAPQESNTSKGADTVDRPDHEGNVAQKKVDRASSRTGDTTREQRRPTHVSCNIENMDRFGRCVVTEQEEEAAGGHDRRDEKSYAEEHDRIEQANLYTDASSRDEGLEQEEQDVSVSQKERSESQEERQDVSVSQEEWRDVSGTPVDVGDNVYATNHGVTGVDDVSSDVVYEEWQDVTDSPVDADDTHSTHREEF